MEKAKISLQDLVNACVTLKENKVAHGSEKCIIKDGYNYEIVNDISSAWEYMLSSLGKPLDLNFMQEVNRLLTLHEKSIPGELRKNMQTVQGSYRLAPLWEPAEIEKQIKEFMKMHYKDMKQNYIEFFIWCCRFHFFSDGNKLTAMICTNKLLIENNLGLLYVPDSVRPQFNTVCTHVYDQPDDKQMFYDFLVNNCYFEYFNIVE